MTVTYLVVHELQGERRLPDAAAAHHDHLVDYGRRLHLRLRHALPRCTAAATFSSTSESPSQFGAAEDDREIVSD